MADKPNVKQLGLAMALGAVLGSTGTGVMTNALKPSIKPAFANPDCFGSASGKTNACKDLPNLKLEFKKAKGK